MGVKLRQFSPCKSHYFPTPFCVSNRKTSKKKARQELDVGSLRKSGKSKKEAKKKKDKSKAGVKCFPHVDSSLVDIPQSKSCICLCVYIYPKKKRKRGLIVALWFLDSRLFRRQSS